MEKGSLPSEVDEQDPYDLLESVFAYTTMHAEEEKEPNMENIHPMFW